MYFECRILWASFLVMQDPIDDVLYKIVSRFNDPYIPLELRFLLYL